MNIWGYVAIITGLLIVGGAYSAATQAPSGPKQEFVGQCVSLLEGKLDRASDARNACNCIADKATVQSEFSADAITEQRFNSFFEACMAPIETVSRLEEEFADSEAESDYYDAEPPSYDLDDLTDRQRRELEDASW